jgi:hypothetical protein
MRIIIIIIIIALLLLGAQPAAAQPALAADKLRFWNLTNATVTSLTLASAGTTAYGPNQCANDRDGEVDHNERLTLTNLTPGRYDVRLGFRQGRVCTVRNVELRGEGRYAFALEPSDLTDCKP